MRCFVEPSPAGGYFVRLRGEPAPVSHHDTEEEAEAAAAVYERGLAEAAVHVTLEDGTDVMIRPDGDAFVAVSDGEIGRASFAADREQPHIAHVTLSAARPGLERHLLRPLAQRARERRIRRLVSDDPAVSGFLDEL